MVQEIEHGTHTVIIGNVIYVITQPLDEPLLYMEGRYRELGR
ncbi:MAG TPA: hypothetical protein VJ889_09795 [Pseudomonas sp.]|nr:hypothetical protein [Pseudomonas sp.]